RPPSCSWAKPFLRSKGFRSRSLPVARIGTMRQATRDGRISTAAGNKPRPFRPALRNVARKLIAHHRRRLVRLSPLSQVRRALVRHFGLLSPVCRRPLRCPPEPLGSPLVSLSPHPYVP